VKNSFDSYLENYTTITVIMKKEIAVGEKKFVLIRKDYNDVLDISSREELGDYIKFSCSCSDDIILQQDYTIIDEDGNRSNLRVGAIVRSDIFDMMYHYEKDDLGVTYHKNYSEFKLWSPVSKEVELEIIDKDGNVLFKYLEYTHQGVWEITLVGDFEGARYRYNVRVNGSFKPVNDPYGISSNANGEYNYVVDPLKFYEFKFPRPSFSGRAVDAVIYEASIRDFTIDKSSGASNRGLYLGMAENHPINGYPTGLEYLKYLGITHLQLMPFFSFAEVDENNKDSKYNWGYNPEQYNVPSGYFASDPNDPYSRINELKELIDAAHANGIRVVMDVVYNHVYKMTEHSFGRLVPGYSFRYDDRGIETDVSGCGNDIASERLMVQQYIVDSVEFWAKEYNIDGFRFDLMGLLDIETINRCRSKARSVDSNILFYGEGWDMPSNLPVNKRANMKNYDIMPKIGFFNDRYRDILKGSPWAKTFGYALGANTKLTDVFYLFTGSTIDNYMFKNPNQTINYVECHDNYTFYDYGKIFNSSLTEKELEDYGRFALSFIILSQGIPFIHSGQEFLRTKNLVENSYNSPDSINKLDWNLRQKHLELVETVKELIQIRKKYKVFRLPSQALIKRGISLTKRTDGTVWVKLTYQNNEITCIIKNNYYKESFHSLNDHMIFNGKKIVDKQIKTLILDEPGIYLLHSEVNNSDGKF